MAAWKTWNWRNLDDLRLPAAFDVVLTHNKTKRFCATFDEEKSPPLSVFMQDLMRYAKAHANKKLSGFVKVVENTTVNGTPLRLIINAHLRFGCSCRDCVREARR